MKYSLSSLMLPLFAAGVSACGQVFLKYAMLKHGPINFSAKGIIDLLSEPRLLLALCLYATALLMWLQVLSKMPLSTAYPILAVTYVLVPLLSVACFDERITQVQVVGIFLVLAGVTLIGGVAGD